MRPYEFWHPRVFEAPYYLYLLTQCLLRGLPPKHLAKANYALDHGELGLGSKFDTQMAFAQAWFLPTCLLDPSEAREKTQQVAQAFAEAQGLPLILKPDIGAVGKGVLKITDLDELLDVVQTLTTPHLLQVFSPFEAEYGVFYVRQHGQGRITGINQKHFPEVIGNGRDNIETLARTHYRYSDHWSLFLRYLDTQRIPAMDECVRLSFVGSHTMGCKFTNDTELLTDKLSHAVQQICDSQPGFNFGRLDVKATDQAAFQNGEFVVIEVNGIASLPTHMFDPDMPIQQAYATFFEHGRLLTKIAAEHRSQVMQLDSIREIWQRAKHNHQLLNRVHDQALRPVNRPLANH